MNQDPAEQRQRRHEGRAHAVGVRTPRIRAVALHELDVALAALEALPDDARVLERTKLLNIVAKATRLLDSLGSAPALPIEPAMKPFSVVTGWRPGRAPAPQQAADPRARLVVSDRPGRAAR
jgi:hypothetical protein